MVPSTARPHKTMRRETHSVNTTLRVNESWQRIARVLSMISGGVLILATLITVADVSARYLFNNPIIGAPEIAGLMMPYAIFLTFGYALLTGNHVRVTLVFDRLPAKQRLLADIFTCFVGLFVLGLLSYFGWLYFLESFKADEFVMARIYLPAWAGKFAMPVGLFVFFVVFLLRLLVNLGRLSGKIKVGDEVTEEQPKLSE